MRHRRRGLDNGSGLVAGWNQLCLVYLSMVAEHGNPAARTAGFICSRLETRYFVPSSLWDDRTDDCAFGADDVARLHGPKFRKLRFQVIADTQHLAFGIQRQNRMSRE